MVLELLKGCGMIRRSEKRRLLGKEALGTEATEFGFSFFLQRLPTRCLIRSGIRKRTTLQGSVVDGISVLPLLNPF